MARKRTAKAKPVRKARVVRKAGPVPVTRAEFDALVALVALLNQRSEIINEIRQQLESTCGTLASQVEKNRRTLEIQFARMAQLQQEIDELKRRP